MENLLYYFLKKIILKIYLQNNINVIYEEENCAYTLKFEGSQVFEIDENSVFSYPVISNNTEMSFEVKREVEEGTFLTIGIEGSSNAKIKIDDIDIMPIKLGNGQIISFPILLNKTNNTLSKFTITDAYIGDYLTLNIHTVKDGLPKIIYYIQIVL